jgi:hypothetical protein
MLYSRRSGLFPALPLLACMVGIWHRSRSAYGRSCLVPLLCALALSACFPVSMGKHRVTPDVDRGATAPVPDIMVSGPAGRDELAALSEAIEASGIDVEFVNGTDCMAAYLDGDATPLPVPLSRLLQADYRERVKDFDIHYVIVIGRPSTEAKRETRIAATVMSFREADDSATVEIRAEGRMQALWPAPLYFLTLFVFYSTPDTEMSATTGLGKVVAEMIRAENGPGPTRLLILESNNLTQITRSTPVADTAEEKSAGPQLGISPNPLPTYVALIKEPLESDDPVSTGVAYNPIYHVMAFVTSVIATPMIWAINKTMGPGGTATGTPYPPPSGEEMMAIKRALEATKKGDWDLAYRELELCITSSNEPMRQSSRSVFEAHRELGVAARNSFGINALRESQSRNGDKALEIERNRLRIYKVIADRDAYSVARSNMRKVFSEYRGDSVLGFDESVIETMALQGDPEAQWQMYWNAANGEALRWLCRAADQSHPMAQQRVGLLFEKGAQGVEKNNMFAYLWYERALQNFQAGAPGRFLTERDAARLVGTLSADQLREAKELAADRGPDQCLKQLGIHGTDPDNSEPPGE